MRLQLLYNRRGLLSSFAQCPASLLRILNRVWVRGYYPEVLQLDGVECSVLRLISYLKGAVGEIRFQYRVCRVWECTFWFLE